MDSKITIEWKQKGNKVYFEYKGVNIYFIMPDDYDLSKTHPDLLKLSEYLMFSPWYDVLGDYKFTRKPGNETGLSFSAGVDSTAAMILQPRAHLIYVERDGIDGVILKQENAIRMIEKMDRGVIRVKTNFELIRTNHGKMIGYSTAIGMGVPTILLADYLGLGYISYGKVLDDQYFPTGTFRDYTRDYIDRQNILKSAGLTGYYATVGCSEVITTKLVDNSKYAGLAFSCLRGEYGKQCNACYKCFRKNLLRGVEAFTNGESLYAINKNPPKMATSLMYGLKMSGKKVAELEYLNDVDVSMLEKIYLPAYDIYENDLNRESLNILKANGFETMSKEEEKELQKLDFRRVAI